MSGIPREMLGLPVLSIRQPWASLIILGFKDVENRCWRDQYRDVQIATVRKAGRFLIHAAKGCTEAEWREGMLFAMERCYAAYHALTRDYSHLTIPRGGVIGVARFDSWVEHHYSPWFVGPGAIVMSDVRPLPFYPCRGMLGFFRLPAPAADGQGELGL